MEGHHIEGRLCAAELRRHFLQQFRILASCAADECKSPYLRLLPIRCCLQDIVAAVTIRPLEFPASASFASIMATSRHNLEPRLSSYFQAAKPARHLCLGFLASTATSQVSIETNSVSKVKADCDLGTHHLVLWHSSTACPFELTTLVSCDSSVKIFNLQQLLPLITESAEDGTVH